MKDVTISPAAKSRCVFAVKLIAFVCVLAMVLNICGTIMDGGKSSTENSSSLQQIPRNSIDVLWMGSSHVYAGIIPQYLYDTTGITSTMASGHGLDVNASYWQLKEILRKQDPKVVVVDIYSVGGPYVYADSMRDAVMRHPDNMHPGGFPYNMTTSAARWIPLLSPNKIPAIIDTYRLTKARGEAYFSLTNVHDSYFDITRKNFDFYAGENAFAPSFGYKYMNRTTPEELLQPFPFGEDPSDYQMYYYWSFTDEQLEQVQLEEFMAYDIQRLMDLSKKKGFELVFCSIPYFANDAERKLFAQVEEMAAENDIAFVGMDDIVIDDPELFDDMGHLNYEGAVINTDFWAEYLTEHYDLEDRRESTDARYAPWREGEESYLQADTVGTLDQLESLTETLEAVATLGDDYIITFMITGDVYEGFSYDDYDLLIEMGLDEEAVDEWFNTGTGVFTAVLRGGETMHTFFDPDAGDFAVTCDVDGFKVGLEKEGEIMGWSVDGTRPSSIQTGLNLTVFCKSTALSPYARCFDLTEIYFEE